MPSSEAAAIYEPHLDALVVELARALTAASLLAALKLLPSTEALTEAMSGADQHDEAWRQRWNKARTGYFVERRKLLGPASSRGRTARPSCSS
jgi:hypothetical protein